MIGVPDGWTGHRTPDGLVLVPPGGSERGAIRYVERLRPIRRVVELVRAAELPANLEIATLGAPRRLVTNEGEHAAIITATSKLGAAELALTFGFVFLDDYYARVLGVASDPAAAEMIAATVESLVASDAHLLGYPRRRRFLYDPPAGWQGAGDLFDTTWYPLDYPAHTAKIRVCAAVPGRPGVMPSALRALLGRDDFMAFVAAPADDVTTASGLSGVEWHMRVPGGGALAEMRAVFVEDDKMLYALQLWSHAGASDDYQVFRRVVDSLQPIPKPDGSQPPASPFSYLVD